VLSLDSVYGLDTIRENSIRSERTTQSRGARGTMPRFPTDLPIPSRPRRDVALVGDPFGAID